MEALKRFLFAYLYTILSIIFIGFSIKLANIVLPLLNDYKYIFDHPLKAGTMIFAAILSVTGSVTFIMITIYNIIAFMYYAFFEQMRPSDTSIMNIVLDENNMIRDSFMEYENGKKVPVYIKRIISKVPPVTSQPEQQEETKNNE